MKKNKSNILGLVAVLLLIGILFTVIYYNDMSYREKTAKVQAEMDTVRAEIAELNALMEEQEAEQDRKQEMEEEREQILAGYAVRISPEDSIHFIRALEYASGASVRSLSFGGENEFYTSSLLNEEGNAAIRGYVSPLTISYETSYGNLKRMLEYLRDYPERRNIESLTASFNETSGYLSGSMTINLYRLEGTGREYEAPPAPYTPIGVENIFGTIR